MRQKIFFIVAFFVGLASAAYGQSAALKGHVSDTTGEAVVGAHLQLSPAERGAITDKNGNYHFDNLEAGRYEISLSAVGYKSIKRSVSLNSGQKKQLHFQLTPGRMNLRDVVVSATRYELDKKEAPVVVNVLSPELLNATQSMSLSEGLNYQSGVRVETNCQNCGFTQVRLNGLQGGYSQILINSRPVFSALNSVYGLDQIPTNIVERVEVVRGGGSALYGSNAIAGTINIITKDPVLNSWQVEGNLGVIRGEALDQTLNFNGSYVSDDLNSGVTFYGMRRQRDAYDANGDGFTELTRLENTTFGIKTFYKPGKRDKLTLNFNAIREYRRGGDRLNLAPHFTDITEELDHNTTIAGLTYEHFSPSRKSKYTSYISVQSTQRDSYYGGLGGGRTPQDSTLARNAYGNTNDLALVSGLQFSHHFSNNDVLMLGVEDQYNRVEDAIPGYNRLVDQQVNTLGSYAQYEWKPNARFKALLGARFDFSQVQGEYRIGAIERRSDWSGGVLNPRLTVLYDLFPEMQLRAGYARGFRAPQAFNEDLHISSVGGEPQFVILSDNLDKETSDAFTASVNYSNQRGELLYDFLLEGFYTRLYNPFTIVSTGSQLPNGSILQEVQNGSGATVSGLNFEANLSPQDNLSFQLGGTLQQSRYAEKQILFSPDAGSDHEEIVIEQFMRNPNWYGYLASNWELFEHFNLDWTGTFTGSMIVPRVVDASGFLELRNSDPFYDMNLKASYDWHLSEDFELVMSAGVRNFLNSYQDDFDSGPTRDSDYIYGPATPRTYFVGLKIGNLH